MKKLLVLICCASILLASGAFAASVTYSDNLPVAARSWSSVFLTLPKFNPAWGTLNSVDITLTGKVNGIVQVENTNMDPANVDTTLEATVTLFRPDMSTLVVALPSLVRTFSATAYDSTLDYGGTSGITYPETLVQKTESAIGLSSPADLALFSGAGTISLPVTAAGHAFGSGAQNLALIFSSNCGAFAQVTYNYSSVPEPSSLLALLSGIGGLAGFVIRRRK